ncbi:protein takeout-like [Periplaneta americana]|uniref:protein takeout-like n=1 Tax=Periplaneta americana TaxID=6978 RepID=UPI0037E7A9A7
MISLNRIVILVVVVTLAKTRTSTEAAKLPPEFDICKRNDPNINTCLRSAIQKAIRVMKDGIPSLHLLPTDPLDITRITIEQGRNRPVSLSMDLRDMKLRGLSTCEVRNVSIDIPNKHVEVDVFIPLLTLDSNYIMDGKFLVLPVTGEGKSVGKIENAHIHVNFEAKPEIKKGNEHWNVFRFDLTISNITKLETEFENLFNGNQELAKPTIAALNDDWSLLWDEVRPAMEIAFGTVLKNVANVIFSSVAEKDMLPL